MSTVEIALIFLVLGALIALILRNEAKSSAPMVIEAIEVVRSPAEMEQAKRDAQYKSEEAREDAARREWYSRLDHLDIGMLSGWSLLIDYRSSGRPARFRPFQLDSVRYDPTGFYLLGHCLRSGEFRHFAMELVHGYADAKTKEAFENFDLWAAQQGVEVNLSRQIEEAKRRLFGQG